MNEKRRREKRQFHGMELSKRLEMVASMATAGNRIADIGCDHAHTSIYLVEQGKTSRVIAMDINEGPLLRAKENVRLYGCEAYITLRLSDGMEALSPGEADTLLLSGMGGGLMVQILSARPDVLKTVAELVLQPQSELERVRRFLHGNGFQITREEMLTEDGKHYTALCAKPGKEHYDREVYYRYGKLLLEQKNASLFAFLSYGLEHFAQVEKGLKKSLVREERAGIRERNAARLEEIQRDLVLFGEALSFYIE